MNIARNIIEYPRLHNEQNNGEANCTGYQTENLDGKRWYYIDLDKFEELIRNDERIRIMHDRMDMMEEDSLRLKNKKEKRLYFAIQKGIGLLVIIASFSFGNIFTFDKIMIIKIMNIIAGTVLLFTKGNMLLWKR